MVIYGIELFELYRTYVAIWIWTSHLGAWQHMTTSYGKPAVCTKDIQGPRMGSARIWPILLHIVLHCISLSKADTHDLRWLLSGLKWFSPDAPDMFETSWSNWPLRSVRERPEQSRRIVCGSGLGILIRNNSYWCMKGAMHLSGMHLSMLAHAW